MWNTLLGALLLASNTFAISQLPAWSAGECQQRISHAYDLLDQVQRGQQKGVLEMRFTTYTTYRPPGKKQLTTTAAHFTLLTGFHHTYLTNGEIELYQDGQVQVSISRAQRTILITATQAQAPNALVQWLQLREQMKTQTIVTNCTIRGTANLAERFITVQPTLGSSMMGKVSSLAYLLDARTDALHQLTLYYPTGSNLYSASLQLDSQRLKAKDILVSQPALRHVFTADHQLLAAYRTYTVQDLRHS